MSRKPEKLDQIWAEEDLCERLKLHKTDSGHSRQLSHWIKTGLKYVDIADKRYFFEQDVIDYLWQKDEEVTD